MGTVPGSAWVLRAGIDPEGRMSWVVSRGDGLGPMYTCPPADFEQARSWAIRQAVEHGVSAYVVGVVVSADGLDVDPVEIDR